MDKRTLDGIIVLFIVAALAYVFLVLPSGKQAIAFVVISVGAIGYFSKGLFSVICFVMFFAIIYLVSIHAIPI